MVPNTNAVKPVIGLKTNSAWMDSILQAFDVSTYRQSFSGAKNAELANTYELHATGNLQALKAGLEKSAPLEIPINLM